MSVRGIGSSISTALRSIPSCSYSRSIPTSSSSTRPISSRQTFSTSSLTALPDRTMNQQSSDPQPPASSSRLGTSPENLPPRFKLPVVPGHQDVHDNEAKLRAISRDFRSDTLTIPTDSMFEAMNRASRGDDVYDEDETTTSFQASIAALTGKEDALFVISGTLSNQLALRTHLKQPPYSVLLDSRSHVHRYEAGGLAFHSGATPLAVIPSNGKYLRWEEDIQPNLILDEDIHVCSTKVVSLENTLGGNIFPQSEILKISKGVKEAGLILHLDGARIWNAAAETGLTIEELCRPFDTVSLCLSKGLGAPIGSILVGPKPFIRKAKHFRKLFGAGIRQCGGIVAAARVAIEEHFPKLKATHELAKWMGKELKEMGVVMMNDVETNMLWIDPTPLGFSNAALKERLEQLDPPVKSGCPRIVVHHQIDPEAAKVIVDTVRQMKSEVEQNGQAIATNGQVKGSVYGK